MNLLGSLATFAAFFVSGCLIAGTPISRLPRGVSLPPPTWSEPGDPPLGSPGETAEKNSAPISPRRALWGLVSPGTSYNAVHFVDFNTGWVVGGRDTHTKKAIIRHTRNAGASWTIQDKGSNDLRTAYFLNANVGYVGGDNGVLFRTDNGGSSWKLQDTGSAEAILDVAFLNLTEGLFLTRDNGLFHTFDAGATWTRRHEIREGRRIFYFSNGSAVIVGDTATYRFEGGVLTKFDGPSEQIAQIIFADSGLRNGWSIGGQSGLLSRTYDGGNRWEEVRRLETPDQYISRYAASALAFSTPYDGMLLAERTSFVTADGGESWDKTDARLNFTKCNRYFRLFDSAHGWAFGDGGTLYRFGI